MKVRPAKGPAWECSSAWEAGVRAESSIPCARSSPGREARRCQPRAVSPGSASRFGGAAMPGRRFQAGGWKPCCARWPAASWAAVVAGFVPGRSRR